MGAHFGLEEGRCFENWEQMLEDVSLDAVLIATPNNLHFVQAAAAMERGIHVLLEKPMTIVGDEAWELSRIARRKGVYLSVALNPPFWAHCHSMREALRSEEMGALESASMYWTGSAAYVFGKAPAPANLPGVVPPTSYRSDPKMNGGGYFIDGGSHLVSEMLWVTERRPVKVSCTMDETPMDMRTSLTILMEGGAVCTINSIGDSEFSGRRVRNIVGAARGTITVNGFEFDTTISIDGRESVTFTEAELTPVSSPVGNICKAIRGAEPLFSPAAHGALVVDVVEAAYLSAATGKAVDLPNRSAYLAEANG